MSRTLVQIRYRTGDVREQDDGLIAVEVADDSEAVRMLIDGMMAQQAVRFFRAVADRIQNRHWDVEEREEIQRGNHELKLPG